MRTKDLHAWPGDSATVLWRSYECVPPIELRMAEMNRRVHWLDEAALDINKQSSVSCWQFVDGCWLKDGAVSSLSWLESCIPSSSVHLLNSYTDVRKRSHVFPMFTRQSDVRKQQITASPYRISSSRLLMSFGMKTTNWIVVERIARCLSVAQLFIPFRYRRRWWTRWLGIKWRIYGNLFRKI